jgi:hypothetical protein
MGFYVICVALAAAVLGDAAVEGLSNAALLWRGRYTDHSSIDLLPVALVATIAFFALLSLFMVHQARENGLSARSLILSTARVLKPDAVARRLPLMLAVQLAILYAMETLEQLAVYHHALGGTLWLGGPVAASLIIHTALTVVCAHLLARAVHASATALLHIAGFIVARYLAVARSTVASIEHAWRIVCVRRNGIRVAVVDRGPPRFTRG